MKEWCTVHWLATSVIIICVILAVDNVLCNWAEAIVAVLDRKE